MTSSGPRSVIHRWRYLVAAFAVVLVFALAYAAAGFLVAARGSAANGPGSSSRSAASGGGACAMSAGTAACCGAGGGAVEPITGVATTTGGVQRLSVTVGPSGYDPNELLLQAGVPAEITFSQSSGCTARVLSEDLGFDVDLTNGPQTVRLAAPREGTYAFSCGMRMVHGTIVVAAGEARP